MSATLFPIDDAESYLRSIGPIRSGLKREGNFLRWQDHDGVTRLTVESVDQRTRDGLLISEVVALTHTSPALKVNAELAARLNAWATASALIPAEADKPSALVCKVGIFSSDRAAAERVYAPFLCQQAA